MYKILHSNKGFTLTEMLTAVMILGILLTVAVRSGVRDVYAVSQRMGCQNQQDYLENCVVAYENGTFADFYSVYLTDAEVKRNKGNDKVPQGSVLSQGESWTLGQFAITSYRAGIGNQRDFVYYSHDGEGNNDKLLSKGGLIITGNVHEYTSAEHEVYGLGRYVYQSGVDNNGNEILEYIDCENEQERFLRYSYKYKGDMKDFILYAASDSCQLTISPEGAVYCTNPHHYREYKEGYYDTAYKTYVD